MRCYEPLSKRLGFMRGCAHVWMHDRFAAACEAFPCCILSWVKHNAKTPCIRLT